MEALNGHTRYSRRNSPSLRLCPLLRLNDAPDDYFTDSPAWFGKLGPLNRPFTTVSRDVKDKAFNVELKRRAKLAIRNLLDAQGAPQTVEA